MDSKEISELTKAVVQVAQMGEGLSNLAKGKVQKKLGKKSMKFFLKLLKSRFIL